MITHIDCFAGPGGICTGLHAAGFNTLVAIEYIKSCCDTYSANHPEVHMIHSDIRAVKAEDIIPYIPKEAVDLVTSGMPCETFSTAGNTSRSFYDDRQFLFREGIRIAKIAKAKMILFENVPGITSKTVEKGNKKLIIDVLKEELIEAGYTNFKQIILDSTKFGVPQRRNRFFILATRYKDWELSIPIDSEFSSSTVGDAILDLPNMKRCGHCGRTLPESEFYRNKTRRDGLDSYCKYCRKENSMKYTDAGQERHAKRMRTDSEYRKKILEYYRRYNARRNKNGHLGGGPKTE